MKRFRRLVTLLLLVATAYAAEKPKADSSLEATKQIVARIQRADYQGDRAALSHLHEELAPISGNSEIASRVSYWRGFALWRRAINGFNESVAQKDQEDALNGAIADFEDAIARAPKFADAEIAEAACWMSLLYLNMKDQARVQAYLPKLTQLMKDAQSIAPDNPRVLWVVGGGTWYRPVEKGGGQEKAMAIYQRGLDLTKAQAKTENPLDPTWGEPELLMNLAWSNLNRAEPDLDAADKYARASLALVPDWHYVRDILIPQIREARTKSHPDSH